MMTASKQERLAREAETQRARAEVTETLNQVIDKLNFSRRIDVKVAQWQRNVDEVRRTKPAVFVAGVAAAAAVAGLAVWGLVRVVTRCGNQR